MNTAKNTASVALVAACALSNSGSIVLLTGTQPATPETALSGNTATCTATYAATAYGSPSYSSGNMQATASFSAASFAPVANGAVTFARGYESDGTTVTADYSVGSVHIVSNIAAVGQYCTNAGNTYVVASVTGDAKTGAASPPTGTGSGIVDGNVTWNYVGAGQLFDVLIGNCNVQVGVDVTPSQITKMPAV